VTAGGGRGARGRGAPSSRPPILLATRSAGKLRELRPLFEARGVPVMDLEELGAEYEAEEDEIEHFETFEENALAKARYFYEVSGGIATVADDSGLEIVALGGAPGVRSKRWHAADRAERSEERGERRLGQLRAADVDAANNEVLVRAVADLADRRARYVCAAAYVGLAEHEIIERGEVSGMIVVEPRGTGGFGYDPYFLSTELGRTFGEATVEEKARVSHRARAFSALLDAVMRGD
jgi:XTP/dITP diphosphohydrolase